MNGFGWSLSMLCMKESAIGTTLAKGRVAQSGLTGKTGKQASPNAPSDSKQIHRLINE